MKQDFGMKIKQWIFMILILLTTNPLHALEAPKLGGRVNDYGRMLSPTAASALTQKLASFEQSQSTQIVVLTIPSLEGDTIEQFAIRVAESWKIGQKGKDNGVLLIVAKAERQIRIEVGMGLQGVLPDITSARIIREVMRPHMKASNFDQGITAGVDAIMAATKGEFKGSGQPQRKYGHKKSSSSSLGILFAVIIAAVILGSLSKYLGGAAGAIGLPLAGSLAFPGMGIIMLLMLAAAGLVGGFLLSAFLSAMRGGGGYYGGGGGFYGGGGSSGGGDSFSGGGGDFDGGGSSDDY